MTPLALYIHFPFCKSKCPYCDFNSHVLQTMGEDTWAQAICHQLTHSHTLTQGRPLASLFFGGGTPSLLAPATVNQVLTHVNHLWGISPHTEISLEANPTSVEVSHLEGYKAAGVNRLSMGIQSLDPAALSFLGRTHSRDEALHALKAAQKIFARYSFDLIYARPGQTLDQWKAELTQALDLTGGHLSLYQLTIEPGTVFAIRHARGEFQMPDEALADDLYEMTGTMAAQKEMYAYEVSNYAKAGHECQHNMIYWTYGDYIGVGPGAHGRLTLSDGTRMATEQAKAPQTWLEIVENGDPAPQVTRSIDCANSVFEIMMMGLRIRQGISKSRFQEVTGKPVSETLPLHKLSALIEEGLLEETPEALRPTAEGLKRVNGILDYLGLLTPHPKMTH